MRAELRRALEAIVAPFNGAVALSFSGGTDSLAMLFTSLEIGVRPTCYTYTVEGFASEDVKRAERVTGELGLALQVVPIPADPQSVLADVRRMIADGIRGKVALQCMHGHYYVAPLVREPVSINGSGVDGLYGSYKQFRFDRSATDKAIFDGRRQKHLDNPNDDCMIDQKVWYGRYGVEIAYPYRAPEVVAWLMARSWSELMRPRYKWATVVEFPEIQARKGLYRPRGSQQIVAGTRALHDILLQLPVNKGHRRVEEIYKDIAGGRA